MKPITLVLLIVVSGIITTGCASGKKTTNVSDSITLKDAFKNDFVIGAAVNTGQINERDSGSAALLRTHFNGLTPENIMKCEIIHPEWDRYDFTLADKLVELGKTNKKNSIQYQDASL